MGTFNRKANSILFSAVLSGIALLGGLEQKALAGSPDQVNVTYTVPTPKPPVQAATQTQTQNGNAATIGGANAQNSDGTPNSFGRKIMGDSFDGASDANQALSSDSVTINCTTMAFNGPVNETQRKAAIGYCNEQLNRTAQSISSTGKKIAKEQAMMGDVSRLSNVAAVAAVGATAVAEMGMKDSSQAKSLHSVANIEKTGSTVSYIAGATDIALGSYALLKQKAELKKLQQTISGTQKFAGGKFESNVTNGKSASDIKAAIDATNKAATTHLMMGAGKMMVGMVAGSLAKQNEKAAQNLGALSAVTSGYITSTNGMAITGTGNNVISVVSAVPATTGASTSDPNANRLVSTGGASSASPGLANTLNNALNKNSGAPSAGITDPAGVGAAALGAGGSSAKSDLGITAVSDATKSPYRSVGSMDMGGGPSAPRMGGDGGGGSGAPDIGSMVAAMMGQDPSKQGGAATGINPNKIYEDAVSGRAPAGDESGVAKNPDVDLFQMVKTKTIDMLAKGRLLGPRVMAQ